MVDSHEALATTGFIIFGLITSAIGALLLGRPKMWFRLLVRLNPNKEFVRSYVDRQQQRIWQFRGVGLLILVWGLFAAYLGITTLIHLFG